MVLENRFVVTLQVIGEVRLNKHYLSMQYELIEPPLFLLIFVLCEYTRKHREFEVSVVEGLLTPGRSLAFGPGEPPIDYLSGSFPIFHLTLGHILSFRLLASFLLIDLQKLNRRPWWL